MLRTRFWRNALLAAAFATSISSCSGDAPSTPSADTELVAASQRTIGQPPPPWLVLQPGVTAYVAAGTTAVACGSVASFRAWPTDTAVNKCTTLASRTLLQVRAVIQSDPNTSSSDYVVECIDASRKVYYVGAGTIAPYIPVGTELISMNVDQSGDDKADQTQPILRDGKGNTLATLLDHTKVRLDELLVGEDSDVGGARVTVLTGEFTGMSGYMDLDDLNASTGDDDLAHFVAVAQQRT